MSFESIKKVLLEKDPDKNDDLMAFFKTVRAVLKKHSGVEPESLNYRDGIVGVTVSGSIEASEVRLRHIQIERDIIRRTGREVKRVVVRVLR